MSKKKKNRIRSREDVIVDIVVHILVGLVAICCLYPIIYCVSMSLSDDNAILTSSVVLLPKGINLDSYKLVFQQSDVTNALKNSIFYTVLGTGLQLCGTLTYGYVLSRKNFVFKKFLTVFTLIPMLFGGGLIPSFLLIKSLHLYNTVWALVLPSAVSIWNALLAKTFFQSTIPTDVIESAVIDGCSDFQIFIRIVLPLSTTIIAILGLYAAVGYWNDYFTALIYLEDVDKKPLQLLLKEILSASSNSSTLNGMLDPNAYRENLVNATRMKYVMIVVSTLPIIVVYPFIQKFFVKGVMLGSIKE